MKSALIYAAPAVAALLALSAGGDHAATADRTVQVGFNNMKRFAAANITVGPGETVTWVLKSAGPHRVVQARENNSCEAQPRGFRSIPLTAPEMAWNHTFTQTGTYWYMSNINDDCQQKMWGVVYVKQGAGTPPPQPQQPSTQQPSSPNRTQGGDRDGRQDIPATGDKLVPEEPSSGAAAPTSGLYGSLLGVATSGLLVAGAMLLL